MNSSPPASIESIAVEIGGVPIVFSGDDPRFHSMVEEHYDGFTCSADSANYASAPLSFAVELLEQGSLNVGQDVRVWKSGECWHASRGDFRADFSPGERQGRIRVQVNPYGLNSILRIVHTIYLANQHGFLLHAASAVRNGSAFVFSGLSGAGKTTISRCAPPDVTLLTDEISCIRADADEFRAHGTPFAGELAKLGKNICAPVSNLFFLERGAKNQILPLEKAEAMRRLLRNILFFCEDAELVDRVFDSACKFLEAVPAYRLAFVPSEKVWELIY
ncbi:MAG TPA: hypothetical protein VMT53_10615 [Terriglobales bacterium]|nr:hypothetical protein [Terriglobales bacterium]